MIELERCVADISAADVEYADAWFSIVACND